MGVTTIEVDLAKLGYDTQVDGKPLFARVKKTLPWGIMKQVETRVGPDGKVEKPMQYTEEMFAKLVVEWNITPRSCGYENGDLKELGIDTDLDKVFALPSHQPKVTDALPSDIVQACISAFGDANKVDEKTEDFSKTS